MDELTGAAPAKLNVSLRVGPVRPDGYHPLAGVMVTLDGLEDVVTIRRSDRRAVDSPVARDEANLAWKALDALEQTVGEPLPPLHVEIAKRIPAEAGLGGGSSDAAATLRLANRLLGLGLDATGLETTAARVGSDVPFLIRGGTQWVTGRGDHLAPMVPIEGLWALVTPPVRGLSTPAVYREFDGLGAANPIPIAPPDRSWRDGDWVRNDLWPAAARLAPELSVRAAALDALRPVRVLLCGSGGSLAALFDDPDRCRAAANDLGDGWCCRPGEAIPI